MDFTSRQIERSCSRPNTGSFTRAAETLLLTPSAMSVLIRELEIQLGFRLFDRTTRHVALTPDGHQLRAVARRTLRSLTRDVAVAVARTTASRCRSARRP